MADRVDNSARREFRPSSSETAAAASDLQRYLGALDRDERGIVIRMELLGQSARDVAETGLLDAVGIDGADERDTCIKFCAAAR